MAKTTPEPETPQPSALGYLNGETTRPTADATTTQVSSETTAPDTKETK